MYLLFLILGIAGLWIGTELVIKGAMKIVEYYKLSQMFVGMTILAIGTDLPEIVVSIDAAVKKSVSGIQTSGLIVGNAIGSAFSQITIVLGIVGITGGYLVLKRKHMYADSFMIVASVMLFFILGFDGIISRKEGMIMILVYLIYYVRLFQAEKVVQKVNEQKFDKKITWYFLMLTAGLFVVVYASEVVVGNAVHFAEQVQIRQSFIGIFIIGLGTSLPELAVSFKAARKKANSLSVGNLIGSNIFDVLMPIGLGGTIAGLEFPKDLVYIDATALFIVTMTALIFFYKKDGLQKKEAIVLIGLFALYAVIKLIAL